MGKTSILFQLLSQLEGSARTVFLFRTLCSPKELLRGLLRDLGVLEDCGNAIRMQEQLNDVLLAEARQGRRVVVVIDEAQNLKDSALELVRMLSNFETTNDKLMQIILAGQPQLREKLASHHLLQLRQRMSIFARLYPFSVEETHLYVRHRLRVAGYDFKTPLFTPQAGALIAKYSEGIPRNINNICFNALSLGCVLKQKSIQEEVVRESLDDLDLDAGGADDPDEERPGRKVVDFKMSEPTTVSQQFFGWRKRLALCIMLLLQFLCFTGGRQSPEALGSHSLADETSKNPQAVSSTPAQKSRQHPPRHLERTSDPAKLWAQVKNRSSDAEVELARLYLAGTAVPQNCAQAQILLLAASRRGNVRAANLLSDYDRQCR